MSFPFAKRDLRSLAYHLPDFHAILRRFRFLFFVLLFIICNSLSSDASAESPPCDGGIFGKWTYDEFGLPAFNLTIRYDDPRAWRKPGVEKKTNLMWHQLGNRRTTAAAYNLGFVKLFYGESGAVWLNEYEPEKAEHSGGFGWFILPDRLAIDRDDFMDRAAGCRLDRIFAAGYFKKTLECPGFRAQRLLFAPYGDYPALVSELRLENLSEKRPLPITVIEYFDVNMRVLDDGLFGRGLLKKRLRDQRVRFELSEDGRLLRAKPPRIFGPYGGFPAKPAALDPELPAVFLAAVDVAPEAWITDPALLFNGPGPVMDRQALLAAGGETPPSGPRPQKRACLAARFSASLRPGEKKVFTFIYGYEKGIPAEETAEAVLEDRDTDSKLNPALPQGLLSPTTLLQWKAEFPRLELPRNQWLGRELAWDYYYLLSASLFDAYYRRHKIPQGGNYLYYSGMDGATRDHAASVLALTYYRPEAARELLEFMMASQEADGRLYYDLGGFGRRYLSPYRPSDLDLWFLWALAEYVFATRDFGFLKQVVPFYPLSAGEEGTVWEHARRSLFHFIRRVGTGPHGHPRLRLSDWNDEMMWLAAGANPLDMAATFYRGESVMNTAMACLVLPMAAELAGIAGDEESAKEAKSHLERMKSALVSAWRGDHLLRAYSGLSKVFGEDDIYLEPQAFALLAGNALSPDREKLLYETIMEKLKKPSALGLLISTSTSGSLTTRPGEQEEGGIWFAINGPAAVALSRLDPEAGWRELLDNTLYRHACVYPRLWFGVWSGPDAWNSVFSERPGETWFMKTPVFNTGPQMFPVQNIHAHCQTLWAAARLAGITPAGEGWRISFRIPEERYFFSCALFSVKKEPDRLSGRAEPLDGGKLELEVELPEGWQSLPLEVRVNGTRVDWERNKTSVNFSARVISGIAHWEIKPVSSSGLK